MVGKSVPTAENFSCYLHCGEASDPKAVFNEFFAQCSEKSKVGGTFNALPNVS